MRTLDEITTAVRRAEPVTTEELTLAICAYDVLLSKLKVEDNPTQLQEYFVAGDNDPAAYIGPANDPRNAESVHWHKTMIGAVKPWDCSACGTGILVENDYEPEGCCSGRECGCMGREINPVFCTDCENKLFKPNQKETSE